MSALFAINCSHTAVRPFSAAKCRAVCWLLEQKIRSKVKNKIEHKISSKFKIYMPT